MEKIEKMKYDKNIIFQKTLQMRQQIKEKKEKLYQNLDKILGRCNNKEDIYYQVFTKEDLNLLGEGNNNTFNKDNKNLTFYKDNKRNILEKENNNRTFDKDNNNDDNFFITNYDEKHNVNNNII